MSSSSPMPENLMAIAVIAGLFALWLAMLAYAWWCNWRCKVEAMRASDVSVLKSVPVGTTEAAPLGGAARDDAYQLFDEFLSRKHITARSPIAEHLRTIFDAARAETQLDVPGLVKSTAGTLFRGNAVLRPVLSIFIIIGLLGTLFGLAQALGSLNATLLKTDATLEQKVAAILEPLLQSLQSAFAPSIWGVFATVVGVLFFTAYTRFMVLPLGGLLERMTLTIWVPQLMPSPSNRMLEHLQIGERQVQRSFEAAQRVAEFADGLSSKTTVLDEALQQASAGLQQMARTADNLQSFSENFVDGVQRLMPFQQELRSLYAQICEQSREFHQSMQASLGASQALHEHLLLQTQHQQEQIGQLLTGLHSYEAAYLRSRGQIDAKLEQVLEQAKAAFESLGRRNAEIGTVLDGSLGKPLRDNLAENFSGVQAILAQRLEELRQAMDGQLGGLVQRLSALDGPINAAAQNFSDVFINFNARATSWFERLQKEFSSQNELNQQRLEHLVSLGEQAPEMFATLAAVSKAFNDSSGSFAMHGEKLAGDVKILSTGLDSLSRSVDALAAGIGREAAAELPTVRTVTASSQGQLNARQGSRCQDADITASSVATHGTVNGWLRGVRQWIFGSAR